MMSGKNVQVSKNMLYNINPMQNYKKNRRRDLSKMPKYWPKSLLKV